jgi:rSAM/selenodomain-associated transferase 2
LLLAVALAMIWLVEPVPLRCAFLAVAALLMLLPTLHPWYLLMVLPFLAVYPSPAWIYLSAGVALTFPVLGHEFQTGVFREQHWIKWIEYLPFFGFLIYGVFRGKREGEPPRYGPVSSLSVVIPTLNESRRIDRCLDSLAGQEGIQEIIVVDGGSNDGTLQKARLRGLTALESTPGRGRQIRMGTETAASDLILVLHGDSRLRSGSARRLLDHLNSRPEVPGGAFGMAFDPVSFRTRVVSLLNAFRARFLGISFGDQGQYVRTEVLDRMGGFPELDLMEDVELSLRLKPFGRPGYLPGGIVVSDRRWQDGGFAGKVGIVVWLCLRYLAERRWRGAPGKATGYYDLYYRRHLK